MRPLLAVLALVLVAGCGPDLSTGDKGYVSGDHIVRTFKPADREKAPAISGTTLEGKQVSVRTLAAGRPTVLNVWGSWCAACRKEAPLLTAAAAKLGDKARFVGIDVRDNGKQDNALAFQRTYGVEYPSIYDPDGRTLLHFPRSVPTYAVPTTIVLDGQGRVAATISGEVPSALTLVELVKAAT